jgi:hypothetical protein
MNLYHNKHGQFTTAAGVDFDRKITFSNKIQILKKNKAQLKDEVKQAKASCKQIKQSYEKAKKTYRQKINKLMLLTVNILTSSAALLLGRIIKKITLWSVSILFLFTIFIAFEKYDASLTKEENVNIIINRIKLLSNNNAITNYFAQANTIFPSTHKLAPQVNNKTLKNKLAPLLNHYSNLDLKEILDDTASIIYSQSSDLKQRLINGHNNGNMAIIKRQLVAHNLDSYFHAISAIESGYDNSKISYYTRDNEKHINSVGMMQMSRKGALEVGINDQQILLSDPNKSAKAGVELLAKFKKQLRDDPLLAVLAYNIGNSRIRSLQKKTDNLNYSSVKKHLAAKYNSDLANTSSKEVRERLTEKFNEQVNYLPLFLATVAIGIDEGFIELS